jgi:hypothetical protein
LRRGFARKASSGSFEASSLSSSPLALGRSSLLNRCTG